MYFLLICYIWIFFFNVNIKKTTNEASNSIIPNSLKINSNENFSNVYIYTIKLFAIYFTSFHGRNEMILFNHFNISNFFINNLILFLIVNFFVFILIKAVRNNNLNKSIDYYFSINNILMLTPFLFMVNTVFTFLFFIEVVSILVLYKLVSSKIWFFNPNNSKNSKLPQYYINMLFFQFWVTFFSTIFIIYFYINIFYVFGSSEWFLISYFNINDCTILYKHSDKQINFLISIFIFSVFFKLGVSPIHLFKLEVYKGIPYLSIFFYTIYFLTVFLFFTIVLLIDFLISFNVYVFLLLFVILFFGILYVIVLIFDVSFLKVFFAYSTIINTIGFILTTTVLF